MKRLMALASVAVAGIAAAPAPAGVADPEPLVATSARETQPAAGLGWLAWVTGPYTKRNQRTVWAQADGEEKFKVNPAGTVAYVSSGGIDGTTLVYSSRKKTARAADLHAFDLVARTRSNMPAGVNSRHYECCGARSGDWLLFGRFIDKGDVEQVFLFNTSTKRKIKVAEGKGPTYVQTGTVKGDWAVWTKCRYPDRCNTFRYNIPNARTVQVPNPDRRSQYAASVTADGTVYFAESSDIECGIGFGIWRYPVGGPRELLMTLPRRHDAIVTNPIVNADSTVTVVFDRIDCRTNASDIYKVTVPAP